MSSSKMTTTLGAPAGGRSSLIGGKVASRASSGTLPGYLYCVSGIGSEVRLGSCAYAGAIHVANARHTATPRTSSILRRVIRPSCRSHRFNRARALSADPASGLEPDSELLRDCVCRRFGSSFDRAPAARLAINFEPAYDDQPDRIGGGDRDRSRDNHPG